MGVPPSQLDGREPDQVTTYTYDRRGRMTKAITATGSRFTVQDHAELAAYQEYLAGLCSKCGGPIDECTAPEKTGPRFRATRIRCQRTDAMMISEEALGDEVPRKEALIWSTHLIPGR